MSRGSDAIAAQRPASVLLVLPEAKGSAESIRRASDLSRALGAELCALVLMPPREPFTLPPSERASPLLAHVRRLLVEVLGPGVRVRLRLRSGLFIDEVVACARELAASVIVISPRKWRCGREVTKLVRRSGVPVLVARGGAWDAVIVAATDLSDRRLPVLRQAVRLAEQLAQPLVVVHNRRRFWGRVAVEPARWRACLDWASQQAEPPVDIALCDASNASEGILRAARSRNADMVVVGTHPRSLLSRLWRRSVAVQVVNRARRSVLVTAFGTPALRP